MANSSYLAHGESYRAMVSGSLARERAVCAEASQPFSLAATASRGRIMGDMAQPPTKSTQSIST